MNAADLIQTTRAGGRSARHSRFRRDAALARVGSITRTVGALSAAATVALAVYLSRAVPGHGAAPTSSANTVSPAPADAAPAGAGPPRTTANGASPSAGDTAGAAGASLSPPTTAPAPARRQAPVISGST